MRSQETATSQTFDTLYPSYFKTLYGHYKTPQPNMQDMCIFVQRHLPKDSYTSLRGWHLRLSRAYHVSRLDKML